MVGATPQRSNQTSSRSGESFRCVIRFRRAAVVSDSLRLASAVRRVYSSVPTPNEVRVKSSSWAVLLIMLIEPPTASAGAGSAQQANMSSSATPIRRRRIGAASDGCCLLNGTMCLWVTVASAVLDPNGFKRGRFDGWRDCGAEPRYGGRVPPRAHRTDDRKR